MTILARPCSGWSIGRQQSAPLDRRARERLIYAPVEAGRRRAERRLHRV